MVRALAPPVNWPVEVSQTPKDDALGNRLVKWDSGALTTSTYDAANQLETAVSSAGTTTFTYDLAGNLQIQSAPTGITTTTWNNDNRQTQVALPGGAVDTFSYNADGQRCQIETSGGVLPIVYDGQAYFATVSTFENLLGSVFTQEPTTYGGLLSVNAAFSFRGLELYNYAFDALGSTISVSHRGVGIGPLVYKAFGELLTSLPDILSYFLWNGRLGYWYDVDTQSYHAGERELLSAIARWTKRDIIEDDVENPFRYLRNDPIGRSDPSGLQVRNLAADFAACKLAVDNQGRECLGRAPIVCGLIECIEIGADAFDAMKTLADDLKKQGINAPIGRDDFINWLLIQLPVNPVFQKRILDEAFNVLGHGGVCLAAYAFACLGDRIFGHKCCDVRLREETAAARNLPVPARTWAESHACLFGWRDFWPS